MNEFDKFFAKKLNKEGQFPRREKNWRLLSKRLDAFDAGLHGTQSHLRHWQIATTGAFILTGVLFWKTLSVQYENTALRQEMAALQEKVNLVAQKSAIPQANDHVNNTATPAPNLKKSEANAPARNVAPLQNAVFGDKKRKSATSQNQQPPLNDDTAAAPAASLSPPRADKSNAAAPIADDKTTISAPLQDVPNSGIATEAKQADYNDWSNFYPLPAAVSLESVVLAPQRRPAPEVLLLPQVAPLLAAAPETTIKPAKGLSRFRAGVQVLAGKAQPRTTGISTIYGQGLTAEFALWRGLSLTASADWLRFDIATDTFHTQFHPNNPDQKAPPPPWFYKLTKVESSQRQRHLGLGLRYTPPIRFWLRPSVQVAHTWVRVAPGLVSYKYNKKFPPPPNVPNFPWFNVKHYEEKKLSNVWRFGAGLEHERLHWAFGLWADYSMNLAATNATFDALFFRAGLQYKF